MISRGIQVTDKWNATIYINMRAMGGEDLTSHSHFSVITGEHSMDVVKKHNNQLTNMA
jgi:hypothetical protein